MVESAAPGDLEQVRTFVNTWWLPNDTRVPADRLAELAADPAAWRAELPAIPLPAPGAGRAGVAGPGGSAELVALREALRASLGVERPVALEEWLERYPLRATFSGEPEAPAVELRPERDGPAGRLLALVAQAVWAGRWARLKACPDCGWVFYDHSRNGARRWCAMAPGGPGGRGCGSIAKVRAYRHRKRDIDTATGTDTGTGTDSGTGTDTGIGTGTSARPGSDVTE
ncbi:CGNR zinc finger domain-containing protein [Nonomuraea sp. NPDC050691]|uniref:CGNR zinc finger domain-containing protein n=1 Tax=Nonomuraea sp. NPDC050691 TaxID=3155661 RepID=UPI0033F3E351